MITWSRYTLHTYTCSYNNYVGFGDCWESEWVPGEWYVSVGGGRAVTYRTSKVASDHCPLHIHHHLRSNCTYDYKLEHDSCVCFIEVQMSREYYWETIQHVECRTGATVACSLNHKVKPVQIIRVNGYTYRKKSVIIYHSHLLSASNGHCTTICTMSYYIASSISALFAYRIADLFRRCNFSQIAGISVFR